jgi:oxygen-dependent protoporphyrinogen oxidase
MEQIDVIVVGGGIAGLSTAYELSRTGVPFVLLESASRAGGVILSEEVDGFTIDGGPDALLVQKPDGLKLCEELGLRERLISTKPPRLAFIQRGGRLHALPAASVLGVPTRVWPFVRSDLFTWHGKLRMGAELVVPRRRDAGDESIGRFFTRRFGVEATRYLAEPLLAGIHAGDVDRLSLCALFPRFAEAERIHGSLLRALRARRPAPPADSGGAFRSFPGGLSEMVQGLLHALPRCAVRTMMPVQHVTALPAAPRDGSGGRPHRFRIGSREVPIAARAVVLATPAFITDALLRDLDPELARLCGGIRYESTATVALAFRRNAVAHPLNGSGFVVPRVEQTGILASSWLSSKWPHRAPEGAVLLRAFFGGARDPRALERSDAELVAQSLAALRPVLGIAGEPLFTRVYRWERANAQHEVGHVDRVAAIDRALVRHPGLFITGSGFRGVGIPDCVADGRATARAVVEWLKADRPVIGSVRLQPDLSRPQPDLNANGEA